MNAPTEDVARHMRQLFDTGSAVGLTDRELLAQYCLPARGLRDRMPSLSVPPRSMPAGTSWPVPMLALRIVPYGR